jgi:hypothetical protein
VGSSPTGRISHLARRCTLALLVALALVAPLGCGSDSGANGRSQRLSLAEESIATGFQTSIRTYCGKLALYLARKGEQPSDADRKRVDGALAQLVALARKKPDAPARSGLTPRQALGDAAEDLEASNCATGFEQELGQALAELPPEQ